MHRLVFVKMSSLKQFLFIVLFCVVNVKCRERVPCDLSDDDCVTQATAIMYADIVKGRPGVETSDPATRHVISVDVPHLRYNLHNAKLTGLKDSKVLFVKFNLEDESLKYGILVPNLVIEGDYKVDGKINNTLVNGKGTSKFTYTDYEIIFHDKYLKNDDEENKRHHHIANFTLDLNVKGKAKYEYTGLTFDGETAVSGEKLQQFDKVIHELVMYSFMQKHIDNINDFLKIVAVGDIVFKYVD